MPDSLTGASLELTLALQREVTERLLLGALREAEAADDSAITARGALFLDAEGRRISASLDEGDTLVAMETMSLPALGTWCMVDMRDGDGAMRRMAIIHPDRAKQALVDELAERWVPNPDDSFGLAAILRNGGETLIVTDLGAAVARDPEVARIVNEIGIGSVLTVPLEIRAQVVGAVTFVSTQRGKEYSALDIEMAESLASRSAAALDHARQHGGDCAEDER